MFWMDFNNPCRFTILLIVSLNVDAPARLHYSAFRYLTANRKINRVTGAQASLPANAAPALSIRCGFPTLLDYEKTFRAFALRQAGMPALQSRGFNFFKFFQTLSAGGN
ncbi:MAG: hypothetical protein JSS81_04800 [Acidobacteria bacterium]|nr:hypothetical protein [Acidobacteriota bacterium]